MRIKIWSPLPHGIRVSDAWGGGSFGDPRGDRKHAGIDYLAAPGESVHSPCDGSVRRLGRCYVDDDRYRLVELSASDTYGDLVYVRLLYVDPIVHPDETVYIGDCLGYAQDVAAKYSTDDKKMLNHVHMDVRLVKGVLLDRGVHPPGKVFINPEYLHFS